MGPGVPGRIRTVHTLQQQVLTECSKIFQNRSFEKVLKHLEMTAAFI